MAAFLVIYADVVADPVERIKPLIANTYLNNGIILNQYIADNVADLTARW